MRSEWAVVRLGDHCIKIGSGATPTGGKQAYLAAGPYRLIRSQNVHNEGFAWQGLAFISEEQARRLDGVSVETGDILVNITGDSVARVCTAPAASLPARVNQHVAIVRPRSASFDSDFLRWFLSTPEQQGTLLALASAGATRDALTKAMLEGLQVPMPPVQVQRDLVAPLVAIANRIDLLRQTNTTLESIAQALFKSWFIDFDPVRAKAEGRDPAGMDAATAALFPAEFEESAFGLIPKGWQVGAFGDLAGLAKGSVNPMSRPAAIFEHYSLPAFDASQLPAFEIGASIKSNKTKVPADVVLQSKLNPHIPRVWFPTRVGESAVCSTEFLPWAAKEVASPEVVYCALTNSVFEAKVRTLVTGTSNSHQRVKPDQVACLAVVVAPRALYDAFTGVARPLLSKVGENRWAAKGLADLRDALLPRLISGQLLLPEVAEQVEDALA